MLEPLVPLMKPAEYKSIVNTYGRHAALFHALTRWDRRQKSLAKIKKKRYRNHNPLNIYLKPMQEILDENLPLYEYFEGPLLKYLEELEA